MPAVTVRNLSDETHCALEVRAARHGRSTEAKTCEILETAVRPADRVKLGTFLAEIGREAGLIEADAAHFERLRDAPPTEPPDFS